MVGGGADSRAEQQTTRNGQLSSLMSLVSDSVDTKALKPRQQHAIYRAAEERKRPAFPNAPPSVGLKTPC